MTNKPLGALNNWIKSEGSIWHIKKKNKQTNIFFYLIFHKISLVVHLIFHFPVFFSISLHCLYLYSRFLQKHSDVDNGLDTVDNYPVTYSVAVKISCISFHSMGFFK